MNDTPTTQKPVDGRCVRCKQHRPIFPYNPLHNCIETAGSVNLIEAAEWIDEIEMNGDRWCEARLQRRQRLMCVRCHDREAFDEQQHIAEMEL